MHVITVRAPWAQAILDLGKNVENRSWYRKYKGELFIHCGHGKVSNQELADFWPRSIKLPEINPRDLGCIIGKVELVEVTSDYDSVWAIPGQRHWILEKPVRITPIPCKGQLGIWTYNPES